MAGEVLIDSDNRPDMWDKSSLGVLVEIPFQRNGTLQKMKLGEA